MKSEIIVIYWVNIEDQHITNVILMLTETKYFIRGVYHNFSNYDCHEFFEKQVDKRKDIEKSDIILKTDEGYILVTYGCIRFIATSRFLSSSLDSFVKTIVDNKHKALENLKKKKKLLLEIMLTLLVKLVLPIKLMKPIALEELIE